MYPYFNSFFICFFFIFYKSIKKKILPSINTLKSFISTVGVKYFEKEILSFSFSNYKNGFFEPMNNSVYSKKINARLVNNAKKYKAYKNEFSGFRNFPFITCLLKNHVLNI